MLLQEFGANTQNLVEKLWRMVIVRSEIKNWEQEYGQFLFAIQIRCIGLLNDLVSWITAAFPSTTYQTLDLELLRNGFQRKWKWSPAMNEFGLGVLHLQDVVLRHSGMWSF